MKLYVRAFAESQTGVFRDIKNHSAVVMEHLIQIFLYPKSEAIPHWKQEVSAALNRVPKLKRSKKFPTADEIIKHSWSIWEDSIQETINVIIEDYGPSGVNVTRVYACVENYMYWISEQLAKSGYVSNTRIYNYIDEMLNNL